MTQLRGAMIGTGYFAHMQIAAWQKIADANIIAVCDLDLGKAQSFARDYDIAKAYADVDALLANESLDFVDIITRPESHLGLVTNIAEHKLAILCQKPLAPTMPEAQAMVQHCKTQAVPLMVNENWRWQAWYRAIKNLLDADTIGDVFHVWIHMRTGDGRGESPYPQQPYFKTYPRLLVYETLVHFIDTLAMFLGDVSQVYALHRRINPVIAGEDLSVISLQFEQGATAIIDANRYTEPQLKSEAFACAGFEGRKGSITLTPELEIHVNPLDSASYQYPYRNPGGYKGASCEATQRHFIDALKHHKPFETNGEAYLKTLAVVEAVYLSAQTGQTIQPDKG